MGGSEQPGRPFSRLLLGNDAQEKLTWLWAVPRTSLPWRCPHDAIPPDTSVFVGITFTHTALTMNSRPPLALLAPFHGLTAPSCASSRVRSLPHTIFN